MAGYDPEPERAWDEHDWERFLQQQDHKTEKYMELLEKYLDHPERDESYAPLFADFVSRLGNHSLKALTPVR